MAESFSASTGSLAKNGDNERRKVLLTGANGTIGCYFAEHAHARYDLTLMVRERDERSEKIAQWGKVVEGDLGNLDRMKDLCAGMDTVVHLAAAPGPSAVWDSLLQANIIGTYNMMVAAKAAGCRRFVYASSIHAVSGYPSDVQVKTSEPVNPGDLYGVSKCFGEALGRYMTEQEGLSVIALRIGGFQPREFAQDPKSLVFMDAWVSRRDLQQLIEKSIDVDNLKFAILNGLSDNRFKRLDISDARELVGYAPVDDFTEINPRLKDLNLDEVVSAHNLTDSGQESGLREHL